MLCVAVRRIRGGPTCVDDPARAAGRPSRGGRLRRQGRTRAEAAARGSARVKPSIASMRALGMNAAVRREASRASSRREHAVARHDDRERVLANGLADRASRTGGAHAHRKLAVTDGFPREHATQRFVDAPVKEWHRRRSRARATPARPSGRPGVRASRRRRASRSPVRLLRVLPETGRGASRASPRRQPRGAAPRRGRVRSTRHRRVRWPSRRARTRSGSPARA